MAVSWKGLKASWAMTMIKHIRIIMLAIYHLVQMYGLTNICPLVPIRLTRTGNGRLVIRRQLSGHKRLKLRYTKGFELTFSDIPPKMRLVKQLRAESVQKDTR